MHDSQVWATGLAAVTGVAVAYKLWRQHTGSKLPLPPAPRSYPLIGNLLAIPRSNEHLGFFQLAEQLQSNVISLSVLGTVIVVLNDAQGAIDLLEKRSNIYSERPLLPMITEPSLMNWGDFITTLGYNNRLKTYRRLIHPWLQKGAIEKSYPAQERQARLLLQRMVHLTSQQAQSSDLGMSFFRMLSATLAHSIYGYQSEESVDKFTAPLKQALYHFGAALLSSNFWVNVIPSLKYVPEWFPGASWKRVAREWREQQEAAVNSSYNWAKERVIDGSDGGSIIRSLLENTQDLEDADGYIKQIAVGLFAGGTGTMTSTLTSFVLAMVLFPETQARAQREIDAVVGRDRLPTMEDRYKLTYVEQLITEVQRWCPPSPNGAPHACRQDNEYQGYLIPKGAIVIGNIWAMSRDPKVYKDPETFNPDRFADASVPPAPTFGFGRRIASILATFHIGMAKDELGNNIVPAMEAENTAVFRHKSFKFTLSLRSDHHQQLICNEAL